MERVGGMPRQEWRGIFVFWGMSFGGMFSEHGAMFQNVDFLRFNKKHNCNGVIIKHSTICINAEVPTIAYAPKLVNFNITSNENIMKILIIKQ